ncbi:MAG: hypothetical protein K2L23_07095, partial [Odoribacter sp.]|nr:hypothetical protein [Odoribacter sp.]
FSQSGDFSTQLHFFYQIVSVKKASHTKKMSNVIVYLFIKWLNKRCKRPLNVFSSMILQRYENKVNGEIFILKAQRKTIMYRAIRSILRCIII